MSHIKQIRFEGNLNNQIVLHNPRKTEEKNVFLSLNSGLVLFKGDV